MISLKSRTSLLCMLIFVCLATSCYRFYGINTSVKLPTDPNTTCKTYLQSIPTFWHKQEEGYYEFVVDSLNVIGKFVYNTNVCLQGFSTEQLKEYFGTPNQEAKTELVYYMSKACLTRNRDCNIQRFKIKDGFFMETLLIAPKPYGVK